MHRSWAGALLALEVALLATGSLSLAAAPKKGPAPRPSALPSPSPAASSQSTAVPLTALLTLEPTVEGAQLQGLDWGTLEFPVVIEVAGSELRSYVKVSVSFARKDWNLTWESLILKPGEDGRRHFKVPVRGLDFPLHLMAIGPTGEVARMRGKFRIKDASAFEQALNRQKTRPWTFTPNLGIATLSYKDTRIPPFFQIALVGKASFSYRIRPPRWDLSASSFFTLAPLATNADLTARLFGLNLRAGYTLPSVREPWRVTLNGGFYYTTCFNSPPTFGYKNVGGPQIFPTARLMLANGDTVSGYLKFSPVSDGISLISLENRELAVGGAYARLYSGTHLVSFTLDFADLHLLLRKRIEISSTSLTLGVSYAL